MAELDLVGIVDIVSEDIAEVSREIKAIKISGKVETSDSERLCISDDGLVVNRDLAVTVHILELHSTRTEEFLAKYI